MNASGQCFRLINQSVNNVWRMDLRGLGYKFSGTFEHYGPKKMKSVPRNKNGCPGLVCNY